MRWGYAPKPMVPYDKGFLWYPMCLDKYDGTGDKEWRWLEYARWTQGWSSHQPFEEAEIRGMVPRPKCWIDDDTEWLRIVGRPLPFWSLPE